MVSCKIKTPNINNSIFSTYMCLLKHALSSFSALGINESGGPSPKGIVLWGRKKVVFDGRFFADKSTTGVTTLRWKNINHIGDITFFVKVLIIVQVDLSKIKRKANLLSQLCFFNVYLWLKKSQSRWNTWIAFRGWISDKHKHIAIWKKDTVYKTKQDIHQEANISQKYHKITKTKWREAWRNHFN